MRILIAPDGFKESLSAEAAAAAIARGLGRAWPEATLRRLALADGGEGTLAALVSAEGGRVGWVEVSDALGRPTRGRVAWLPDGAALIESADACGVERLGEGERDPLRASTRGVGGLVRAALDGGARRLLIGLGGSATVDGGAGLLRALGAALLDAGGGPIAEGGGGLEALARVELSGLDSRLGGVALEGLCDVQSPLLGPQGARRYMAQKGATAADAARLAAGLARLAAALGEATGVADLGERPGGGAAGGLGAALLGLGARLVSGSGRVAERLGLAAAVADADLVIGGEGRVDAQTLAGKAMGHLAALCRGAGVPLVVLCGARDVDLDALEAAGVTAAVPIAPGPITLAQARGEAAALLEAAARQVGALWRAARAVRAG